MLFLACTDSCPSIPPNPHPSVTAVPPGPHPSVTAVPPGPHPVTIVSSGLYTYGPHPDLPGPVALIPWGGTTISGFTLTNTCPIDNWLMIIQVLLVLGKLHPDVIGQAGCALRTAMSLIGHHLYADSKLSVVPFTPVVIHDKIDLYGNEADYVLKYLQPFLQTMVTTCCSESTCPSPMNNFVTYSTVLGIPSVTSDIFKHSLEDWLYPKPNTCGRKFQQKPPAGIKFKEDFTMDADGKEHVSWHCAGERTSSPRMMINFKNIFIFSVDLLSRAGKLNICDLPSQITVNGKALKLQAATLWNGNHYIGIFCDAVGKIINGMCMMA